MIKDKVEIVCPSCGAKIRIPFIRKLQAQAIEEYDERELSAQDSLSILKIWLARASLWDFIRYWWER